jgi:hypothetical protein
VRDMLQRHGLALLGFDVGARERAAFEAHRAARSERSTGTPEGRVGRVGERSAAGGGRAGTPGASPAGRESSTAPARRSAPRPRRRAKSKSRRGGRAAAAADEEMLLWHEMEQSDPGLFAGMYQLWAVKISE